MSRLPRKLKKKYKRGTWVYSTTVSEDKTVITVHPKLMLKGQEITPILYISEEFVDRKITMP